MAIYTNNVVLTDTDSNAQNPLQDETLVLLRTICRNLSSLNFVDSQGRQIVYCDGFSYSTVGSQSPSTFGTGLTPGQVGMLTNNVNTHGSGFQSAAPVVVADQIQNVWQCPVDQRWQYIDASRNGYSACIRRQLVS